MGRRKRSRSSSESSESPSSSSSESESLPDDNEHFSRRAKSKGQCAMTAKSTQSTVLNNLGGRAGASRKLSFACGALHPFNPRCIAVGVSADGTVSLPMSPIKGREQPPFWTCGGSSTPSGRCSSWLCFFDPLAPPTTHASSAPDSGSAKASVRRHMPAAIMSTLGYPRDVEIAGIPYQVAWSHKGDAIFASCPCNEAITVVATCGGMFPMPQGSPRLCRMPRGVVPLGIAISAVDTLDGVCEDHLVIGTVADGVMIYKCEWAGNEGPCIIPVVALPALSRRCGHLPVARVAVFKTANTQIKVPRKQRKHDLRPPRWEELTIGYASPYDERLTMCHVASRRPLQADVLGDIAPQAVTSAGTGVLIGEALGRVDFLSACTDPLSGGLDVCRVSCAASSSKENITMLSEVLTLPSVGTIVAFSTSGGRIGFMRFKPKAFDRWVLLGALDEAVPQVALPITFFGVLHQHNRTYVVALGLDGTWTNVEVALDA